MPSKEYGEPLPHLTLSVCPECGRILPAEVYAEDGKVWIKRTCPEHGEIKEVYYEDVELYEKFRRFAYSREKKLTKFHTDVFGVGCPYNCGLCPRHKSATVLLNIVLTNRCDLSCFYCFFYAREGNPIYEPTLEQIRYMLRRAREEMPYPPTAVQYTGGEPTLRDDLPKIVKMAYEEGYTWVQVNTNGIRLAFNPQLAKDLQKAGVTVYYLSFDGMDGKVNFKNHWEIPYIFKNVREAKSAVVLVPTVIRGYNTDQLGDIINFGLNHMDIVRSVNFQPVSLTGRLTKAEREKMRITIPGTIKLIEEQTNGFIKKSDWYPIPVAAYVADFAAMFTGKKDLSYFTSHFACGASTYLIKDGEKIYKITDLIDVDGMLDYIIEKVNEWNGRKPGLLEKAKVIKKLLSYVQDVKLSFLDMKKIIRGLFTPKIREVLVEFHHHSLFLGMMHFMDRYNYDVERVERCVIHYAMPDGRVVPFCAFNIFPEVYRDAVQEKYAYSWEEWLKLHPGYDMKKEKYIRTKEFIQKVENSQLYKDTYINIRHYW